MKLPLKHFKAEYLCSAADVGLECSNISFQGLCLVPSLGNKLYFTCWSLFVLIMSVLIHLRGRKRKNRIIKSVEHSARGRRGTSGMGRRGIWGGLLRHRKSVFKKRRCYWESWNHLINQERETELSPAGVQSKPEQLWVLRGGPNPLVAPPGAWKPGGESPFVHTKATLTRFHCDKKWEGCFVGLKNSQQEVRIRCPFIFQALH